MNAGQLINDLTIFALAILLGFEVISRVPATLHTPLMSGANAIHGIVLVGAIGLGATADNPLTMLLALVAIVFASANVIGGYWVTDRMLQMFKRRPAAKADEPPTQGAA
jgi:NAD(P) transhydrogenase subunit alpha